MKMKIKEKIAERRKKGGKAITQRNIEESRDEIISKGKKFKYPFQYAKHRLIITAVAIGVVAIGVFALVGWVQLYKAQNTGEVMYRFTKALGLSVADVDGVKVRFSDYLMLYRSSITSVERQQGTFDNSDSSRQQKEYFKRQALNAAEDYSFAMAKLDEIGKSVTDEEINEVIEDHKIINGEKRSNEAFDGIVKDNFGLNINEYRRLIMLSLSKKKASVEYDKAAKELIEEISGELKAGVAMADLAQKYAENELVSYEAVDDVEYYNLDSGRAIMAAKLVSAGDISDYFVSKNGDGYYIVQLRDKTEERVSYSSIWVRFKWLDDEMAKLRDEGKVREKIDLATSDEEGASEEETGKTEAEQ